MLLYPTKHLHCTDLVLFGQSLVSEAGKGGGVVGWKNDKCKTDWKKNGWLFRGCLFLKVYSGDFKKNENDRRNIQISGEAYVEK